MMGVTVFEMGVTIADPHEFVPCHAAPPTPHRTVPIAQRYWAAAPPTRRASCLNPNLNPNRTLIRSVAGGSAPHTTWFMALELFMVAMLMNEVPLHFSLPRPLL